MKTKNYTKDLIKPYWSSMSREYVFSLIETIKSPELRHKRPMVISEYSYTWKLHEPMFIIRTKKW